MEEQTRLLASRGGYRGHVTRLFNKIDELVEGEFDEYTIRSLNSAVDQLTKKMDKITNIDQQLVAMYNDATELESAVMEAEGLHDDILDKIARVQRYIELKQTDTTPPLTPASVCHESTTDASHECTPATSRATVSKCCHICCYYVNYNAINT